MERALQITRHFRLPTMVCINKTDIYPEAVKQIENFCRDADIELVGKIPFDQFVTEAMVSGHTVTGKYPEAPVSREIMSLWQRIHTVITAHD